MIIYATKQTAERFGMPMPDELSDPLMRSLMLSTYERERGDRMLEWGAKANYLLDGYRLYDFVDNGVLRTKELNRGINRSYPVREKVNGKTEFFFPADKFAALLRARYASGAKNG